MSGTWPKPCGSSLPLGGWVRGVRTPTPDEKSSRGWWLMLTARAESLVTQAEYQLLECTEIDIYVPIKNSFYGALRSHKSEASASSNWLNTLLLCQSQQLGTKSIWTLTWLHALLSLSPTHQASSGIHRPPSPWRLSLHSGSLCGHQRLSRSSRGDFNY